MSPTSKLAILNKWLSIFHELSNLEVLEAPGWKSFFIETFWYKTIVPSGQRPWFGSAWGQFATEPALIVLSPLLSGRDAPGALSSVPWFCNVYLIWRNHAAESSRQCHMKLDAKKHKQANKEASRSNAITHSKREMRWRPRRYTPKNEIIKRENKVGRHKGAGFGQKWQALYAYGKRRGNVVEMFYSVETVINCTHVCFKTAEPSETDFIFGVCDVLDDTNTLKPTIRIKALLRKHQL